MLLTAFGRVRAGSRASPAVTPTNSTPTNANTTICSAVSTPPMPSGNTPPWSQRLAKLAVSPNAPIENRITAKPDEDEPDDRDDLDRREPELELTEQPHGDQVGGVQHRDHDEGRNPLRQIGKPVLHVDAGRRDLRHRGDDPGQPVSPSRDESDPPPEELGRVAGERTGHRAVERELAERPHDQEDHGAGDRVADDQPGPRVLNGLRRAEKEPYADRSADRDHPDLTSAQASLQLLGSVRDRRRVRRPRLLPEVVRHGAS